MTTGTAKAKVEEVQAVLLQPELAKETEYDTHRNLLRAAHSSTNGNAASIEQLSETLGLFAATYVEDRTRERTRISNEFNRLHASECPFSEVDDDRIKAMVDCVRRGDIFEPVPHAVPKPSEGTGRFEPAVAAVASVASALRPIAWPLAIVCFSPNAVELVRIVIAAFAKQ